MFHCPCTEGWERIGFSKIHIQFNSLDNKFNTYFFQKIEQFGLFETDFKTGWILKLVLN